MHYYEIAKELKFRIKLQPLTRCLLYGNNQWYFICFIKAQLIIILLNTLTKYYCKVLEKHTNILKR